LVPNIIAHDRCVCDEAKKSHLSETAEKNARVRARGVIPVDSDRMMHVLFGREREPDIYVRE
jgi:hypothetical protein